MAMKMTKAHCVDEGCPEHICSAAAAAGFTWAQIYSLLQVALPIAQKAWPIIEADIAAGKNFVQVMWDVVQAAMNGAEPPVAVTKAK